MMVIASPGSKRQNWRSGTRRCLRRAMSRSASSSRSELCALLLLGPSELVQIDEVSPALHGALGREEQRVGAEWPSRAEDW